MRPEETLEQHYVDAFEANLGTLPQQKQSRLISRVDANTNFTKPGDMFNADDMGASEPEEVEERIANSPDGHVAKRRRVGFFVPYQDGKWLDDVDQAKSLSDPSNAVMQAMQFGHERFRDKEIIRAALAPAREGRTGETVVAFPAAQQIAQNDWTYYDSTKAKPVANAGLTLSKLISTKTLLDKAEVDAEMGPLSIAVDPEDIGQLLRDPMVTSADFNTLRALQSGEINDFMGFHFVRYNKLPVSGGVRSVVAWRQKAIMYRGRPIKQARISERADKSYNWYAFYKAMHGATRRYDEGVVQILCNTAPA